MNTSGQQTERVFESGQSEPLDDFWLEQGKKLMEGTIPAIGEAASSLIKAIGLLKGIHLGILGFGGFVPKDAAMAYKFLFIVPLLLWLTGLYFAIKTLMTERFTMNPNSPDDIKKTCHRIAGEKQKKLNIAFWCTSVGVVLAVILVLFHIGK